MIARFLLAANFASAAWNALCCMAYAWKGPAAAAILFAIVGSFNYTVAQRLKQVISEDDDDE